MVIRLLIASTRSSAGVTHRPAERGVDDVGRRQAVVDPRPGGRPDRGLDDVDEGGDVVIGHPLSLGHGLDERRVDHRGAIPAGGRIRGRHDADGDVRLGGEQFDLQPPPETSRVGPHDVHLGK